MKGFEVSKDIKQDSNMQVHTMDNQSNTAGGAPQIPPFDFQGKRLEVEMDNKKPTLSICKDSSGNIQAMAAQEMVNTGSFYSKLDTIIELEARKYS
jgi:hypothetical protein